MSSHDGTSEKLSSILERAIAHHNQGNLSDAEVLYKQVLDIFPSQADALHLFGLLQYQRGDAKAAQKSIERAIGEAPGNALYFSNLSIVHVELKQYDAAVETARTAANLAPENPDILAALGTALHRADHTHESESVLRRTLLLNPDHIDALTTLGHLLLHEERYEEAKDFLTQALRHSPKSSIALVSYGKTLLKLDRVDEAISNLQDAYKVAPKSATIAAALADAYLTHDEPNRALDLMLQATNTKPQDVNIMNGVGHILRDLDRHAEALKYFNKAIGLSSEHPDSHVNAGLTLLSDQKFSDGWVHYAYRSQQKSVSIQEPKLELTRWAGQDLSDKHLAVWTEQGLGDEILQASLVPDLASNTRKLTLICSDRLAPIFTRSFPYAKVCSRTNVAHPSYTTTAQMACPLIDTGQLLRKTEAMFPRHEGYLKALHKLTSATRSRYTSLTNEPSKPFVISLSWQSGHALYGARNTIPLEDWRAVLEVGRDSDQPVIFVAAQYAADPDEISDVSHALGVPIYQDHEVDHAGEMDPVAAQLSASDLVISTSTTTAQLAAALARPTWHLPATGLACGWYWLTEGEVTPWYPAMRQFRRPQRDGRKAQIESVAAALKYHLQNPASH